MVNKLLRSEEVAELLNISKAMAYRIMADGRLPVLRLGRAVRVRPEDLEAFVANNVSGGLSISFEMKPSFMQR